MIWQRLRRRQRVPLDGAGRDFETVAGPGIYELLEEAPLAVLVLDSGPLVLAANGAARELFAIDQERLPMSLLMATREVRLEDALSEPNFGPVETRLVHHQRTVVLTTTSGLGEGERLVFVEDVTEARRLEMVRQEFVANLSHELKTPLTSLRIAAESLLGDPPAEARGRFSDRVITEVDHLAAIIDNLRQLAEIEAGRAVVSSSRFELGELLAETAARLHIERPLNIKVAPEIWITSDRPKLAQMVVNLLDNAVKFSPPGSAIDVKARMTDGQLLLKVRDRGPGISPEHWDRVFERFYKVDPARSREMPGSGLGLAITKHLAIILGGRVWTAAARGGGQVFNLELPLVALNEDISSA